MSSKAEPIEITWRDYRILVDRLQFTLQVKKVSKKQGTDEEYERFHDEGYYSDLDHCLRRLVRLESLNHGNTFELKEYINLWKQLSLQLKADLSRELSVINY